MWDNLFARADHAWQQDNSWANFFSNTYHTTTPSKWAHQILSPNITRVLADHLHTCLHYILARKLSPMSQDLCGQTCFHCCPQQHLPPPLAPLVAFFPPRSLPAGVCSIRTSPAINNIQIDLNSSCAHMYVLPHHSKNIIESHRQLLDNNSMTHQSLHQSTPTCPSTHIPRSFISYIYQDNPHPVEKYIAFQEYVALLQNYMQLKSG